MALYGSAQPNQAAVTANKNVTRPQSEDIKAQAARITVKLPASARLWVDEVNCPLTSSERSFKTPALTPGQQYYYTFKMEVEQDGRNVTENRRVFVAAGQQVNVDFNSATVTAQR